MKPLLLAGMLGLVIAAATTGARADDDAKKQEILNGGYYLLHHLDNDEDQLPLLLDLKHASKDIIDFADRVSQTAKAANAALEKMQDHDPAISFDHNPLPKIERDIRESKVLAEQETSPARARELNHISSEWEKIRQQAVHLLSAR